MDLRETAIRTPHVFYLHCAGLPPDKLALALDCAPANEGGLQWISQHLNHESLEVREGALIALATHPSKKTKAVRRRVANIAYNDPDSFLRLNAEILLSSWAEDDYLRRSFWGRLFSRIGGWFSR